MYAIIKSSGADYWGIWELGTLIVIAYIMFCYFNYLLLCHSQKFFFDKLSTICPLTQASGASKLECLTMTDSIFFASYLTMSLDSGLFWHICSFIHR